MEATEKKEIYFYVYNVFWKDDQNINSKYWYRKIFLSFKEAKAFAKSKKDKLIPLSLKEFDLLSYLASNMNKAITKETLLSDVWGTFSLVEPQTLTVHISWLREKLEDDSNNPKYIKTVRGVGYMLTK